MDTPQRGSADGPVHYPGRAILDSGQMGPAHLAEEQAHRKLITHSVRFQWISTKKNLTGVLAEELHASPWPTRPIDTLEPF